VLKIKIKDYDDKVIFKGQIKDITDTKNIFKTLKMKFGGSK